MRRTKRNRQTLRGLRVETLERRNLLAFGGLRMFLSYSENAESSNRATETKTTVPAIVAIPVPIQTPVVVQSFVPVSLPAVLAPPASISAEPESKTVPAIQVPAATSQLSVFAETTMPNAVIAPDALVVEAADSSSSTGTSLRSVIASPSATTVIAELNDTPVAEVLSPRSDSVEVETIAEAISTDSIATDSIATQPKASVESVGESESFIDALALPSVGFTYLPETTVQLSSGLEELSFADLDNGIGGNDGSLESINDSDDNRSAEVTGISVDDTNGAEVYDSFIEDGSAGDLDSGLDDSNDVFEPGNDGGHLNASNGDERSGNDRSCDAFDNEILHSSGVNEVDDDSGRLMTFADGASSATVTYGTWSASLVGSGTGSVVYQREGSEAEFSARVFGATPNATLEVVVDGVRVGNIRTNSTGSGRLKLENDDGRSLPVGFPVIGPTVNVNVGSSISGVFGQRAIGSHD